jgi:NADH-quinone oxidoreductase subunit H
MTPRIFITQLLGVLGIIVMLGVNVIIIDWWERKFAGHVQLRPGPLHTGFHGILQPFADMIKFITKEDTVPDQVDHLFYWLAPMIAVVPTILAMAVLPLAPGFALADIQHGFFFVFAMQTIMPFGYTLIGWASRNKFSLIGGLRSAAQLISYEIPMLLAALSVIIVAGSGRITDIVNAQTHVWYAFKLPLAFVIFMVTAVAEMNRAPFDMTEAESELVAGIHTEYSGIKFGLVMMAEYTAMFVGSWVITMVFLGGWNLWPLPPSPLWVVAKIYVVQTFICWLRWTWVRLRMDSIMALSWKYLIPAALGNLLIFGGLAMAFKGF